MKKLSLKNIKRGKGIHFLSLARARFLSQKLKNKNSSHLDVVLVDSRVQVPFFQEEPDGVAH